MLAVITTEHILIVASLLLALSLFTSNLSGRFGVPALLVFLVIGMLAGSDGPGGIYFNDPWIAQFVGVIALVFIIFVGGLDTNWLEIKPIRKIGLILSTLGVLLTAAILAIFAKYFMAFSWKEAMLLGAIVSSTDAAAVFAILRSRKINLKPHIKSLLEFESGSNDPMAVFLTVVLTGIAIGTQPSIFEFLRIFLQQMALGGIIGYASGRALFYFIRKIKFDYDGLYPVMTLSGIILTYAMTAFLGGSGFLAVYVAGLILGKEHFTHKKMLMHFHQGLAWLMQIAMFLVLGMLVYPSQLVHVAGSGMLIACALIFVARPVSVFLCMAYSSWSFKEKLLISWVGLRGAVPITIATFPLLAHVGQAHMIFNVVFFIVLISTLVQGTSISFLARILHLDEPFIKKQRLPIELEKSDKLNTDLLDILVPKDSGVIGKQIKELDLPEGALIILINRDDKYLVPTGSTVLQEADMLLALVDPNTGQKLSKVIDAINE